MSNSTTTNPIVCDTAGVLISTGGAIYSIMFVNTGTPASMKITLCDSNDTEKTTNELITIQLTDNKVQEFIQFNRPLRFSEGLLCSVIGGGKAYIQI